MIEGELSQQEIDQVNQLREAQQVGKEAESFLVSKLGQWVINNAREQKQDVLKDLILADPTNAKAVAELQGKAVLLGLFEEWLNQAFREGEQATQFFKTYVD